MPDFARASLGRERVNVGLELVCLGQLAIYLSLGFSLRLEQPRLPSRDGLYY